MLTLGTAFALALAVASLAMVGLATHAWRQPSKPGSRWFAAMAASGAAWVLSDVIGMVLVGPGVFRFWVGNLHSVFAIAAAVAWIGFVVTYTGRGHWLTRRRLGGLLVIPATSAIVLLLRPTSPLVVRDYSFREVSGLTLIANDAGPVVLLIELYLIGILVWLFAFLFVLLLREERPFAGQLGWILVGSVAIVVGVLVDIFDVTRFDVLAPSVGVTIQVGSFAVALFRHRLFDLVPAVGHLGAARAFADLDDGVLIVDDEGTIARANPAVSDVLHASTGSLVGADVRTYIPEIDPTASTTETTVERGGRRYRVSGSVISGHDGRQIGSTLVLRDVTDRERREQRLAVLGRVLRHNLRNDANVIEKHAGFIQNHVDADAAGSAGTIRTLAMRMAARGEKARRAQQVLGGPVTPSRVDLRAFLEAQVERVDEEGRAAIEVAVPEGISVTTDLDVLGLAVENVLENALLHGNGPETGVRVSAEPTDVGVEIAIEDRGPGIPEHEVDVLDAGDETQREHGSGLGLWLVHWAMQSLGGTVTFDASDEGTHATLGVPDREPSALDDSTGVAAAVNEPG